MNTKIQIEEVEKTTNRFRGLKTLKNTFLSKSWVFLVLLISASNTYAAEGMASNLKEVFASILGVLFLVGFIWGILDIWAGVSKGRRGDSEAGKEAIVWGCIRLAAGLIMGGIATAIGMGEATIIPSFK